MRPGGGSDREQLSEEENANHKTNRLSKMLQEVGALGAVEARRRESRGRGTAWPARAATVLAICVHIGAEGLRGWLVPGVPDGVAKASTTARRRIASCRRERSVT